MNKEDNLFSVHFIIVKLIKLVSVIYLYLRTFGLYKEKLQNERIERLNFLNPINHAEIRNIINEDEEEMRHYDNRRYVHRISYPPYQQNGL